MHELSLLFNKYVDSNKLSHPRDAAHIILDDRLSDAILKKGELLGTLSRKESIERIVAGCQHWHSLTFPGGEETFHKGSCPSIRVIIKDVGKRVVTLISFVSVALSSMIASAQVMRRLTCMIRLSLIVDSSISVFKLMRCRSS